jgi:hypothetical protein
VLGSLGEPIICEKIPSIQPMVALTRAFLFLACPRTPLLHCRCGCGSLPPRLVLPPSCFAAHIIAAVRVSALKMIYLFLFYHCCDVDRIGLDEVRCRNQCLFEFARAREILLIRFRLLCVFSCRAWQRRYEIVVALV